MIYRIHLKPHFSDNGVKNMEDLKIKGYRIHTMIKIPHLNKKTPTFSYQFLIYDNVGKIQNYPFSKIIAQSDLEFQSHLNDKLESYLNSEENVICHIF